MNAVCNMPDGNIFLRPPGKQWPKEAPAHGSVQAAHPVDATRTTHGQIGHVKRFIHIMTILSPQGHQIGYWNLKNCCKVFRIRPNERRGVSIERRFHWRMGGKHISRTSGGQRNRKRQASFSHHTQGTGEDDKCRMPFIEMAHVNGKIQGFQRHPSANAQHNLLD